MLIIFDLDDTLIDTSGTITPFKLKECLKRLVEAGMEIPDLKTAYQELFSINIGSEKTRDALEKFIVKRQGNPHWIDRAIKELTAPLPEDFRIPTTPHAKEILEHFAKRHRLALVTGGHSPFQYQKLEKAGIDKTIFSKIAIPEDSIKKPFYQGFIEEFSISPEQIWVCGDRISMDLLPAHELGFQTVHMRWGRGAVVKTEKWVRHVISDLGELKGIIR